MEAQARIVATVQKIVATEPKGARIAIVAHGGVGALLLTSVTGAQISLDLDQPGSNGGNYFAFNADTWTLTHGWRPIDP